MGSEIDVFMESYPEDFFLEYLRVVLVPTSMQMWMAFARELRDLAGASIYFHPTSFLATKFTACYQQFISSRGAIYVES